MRRRSKRRQSRTLMVNNCPPTKEAEMKFIGSSLALIFFLVLQGTAQKSKIACPSMAPLPQYFSPRCGDLSRAECGADITLRRCRNPPSGYQTAVRGTDGFVCVVAPSWSADFDDPDFWDPGLRAPICYNALVARSQAPATLKGTRVVLTGGSNAQVLTAIKAAIHYGGSGGRWPA
jgi:hypothetical protein